ncbi:MAG: amidohydrolase [Sphingomonas sp.]|jgi:imidazolonepropionase-like amidohydrolase|uniref:amidohydrolase n=1 Tax=Sphingomonas sp. TaxID=28214 RepID=UPI00356627FE
MKRALAMVALVAAPLPAAAQSIAIVHAKAWTMLADAPVENATILIADGRIVSVKTGGAVPAGVTVIDAAGQPVTPGLMNGATQIGLTEVSSAQDTRDTVATGRASGPSFDVSYALNGNSTLVELARADGVTRALSFPGASETAPFSGQASTVRLRPGVDILDHARAAMVAVIGGGAWDKAAGSRAGQWGLLRASLDEARLPATSPVGDDALLNRRDVAAVRQVLAGAMPLAIVTHRESDIRQAAKLAQEYRIKVVIIGGSEAWRAADALAAAHVAVVLDPEANMPATFDQIGTRQDNAAILTRAGVTVAFGLVGGALEQNYNAGLVLREGAGIAVANGLTYIQALRAVTVNPAAIWAGRPATIAPGGAADLVVWDGDPLEPSSGAAAVIIEGRQVPVTTRQSALQQRYAPLAVAP